MRDFKDVVSKLNEFTSADDIAAHFEEHEVLAVPMNAFSCAVSEYVATQISTTSVVATSFDWDPLGDPRSKPYVKIWETGEKMRLSPVVHEFIRKFDDNAYPKLNGRKGAHDA